MATVTIASGAALSGPAALKGYLIVGIFLPAAWDAAALTAQISNDGTSWFDLFDETAELSFPAAANRFIRILPEEFAGASLVRFRSGTSAAPVNQTAARSITLVLREA